MHGRHESETIVELLADEDHFTVQAPIADPIYCLLLSNEVQTKRLI